MEPARAEHRAKLRGHIGVAADHDAVVLRVEPRDAKIGKQTAVLDQVRDTALMMIGLLRHGRVVVQLVSGQVAQQLVLAHLDRRHP